MCRVLDLYIYLFLTGGIYIYELTKCKVVSLSCVLRVYKPSIVHSDCLFSDSTAPPPLRSLRGTVAQNTVIPSQDTD